MIVGSLDKKDYFSLFVGLFAMLQIRVVGTFSIAEIIAVLCFPFIIRKNGRITNKYVRILLSLACLAVVGGIISCVCNDTPLPLFIKGFFSQLLFCIDLYFCYYLLKDNYRRVLLFWLGLGVSNIISFYFFPTSTMSSYENMGFDKNAIISVWHIYFIKDFCIAIIALLYYRGYKVSACMLVVCFAFYALFSGSRNIFLSFFISAVVLCIIGKIDEQNRIQKQIKLMKKIMIVFVGILISVVASLYVYEYLASNKILGEKSYNKYMVQKFENAEFGILGSRIQFFVGVKAILENPIIGYGYYPVDKTRLFDRFAHEHDLYYIEKPEQGMHFSAHSHVLNSYIYGSILSVLFWLYALFVVILFFKYALVLDDKMVGFFVITIFPWLWDYFFSPFGARLQESMLLISIALMLLMGKMVLSKYKQIN